MGNRILSCCITRKFSNDLVDKKEITERQQKLNNMILDIPYIDNDIEYLDNCNNPNLVENRKNRNLFEIKNINNVISINQNEFLNTNPDTNYISSFNSSKYKNSPKSTSNSGTIFERKICKTYSKENNINNKEENNEKSFYANFNCLINIPNNSHSGNTFKSISLTNKSKLKVNYKKLKMKTFYENDELKYEENSLNYNTKINKELNRKLRLKPKDYLKSNIDY